MEFQAALSEARVRLKALVRLVQETGESVVLTERGEPVARLAPAEEYGAPEDPSGTSWSPPEDCESPEMALRHLFPTRIDEEEMVGVYPFGDQEVVYPIEFVLCPSCGGRGRGPRRDLAGQVLAEEPGCTCEDGPGGGRAPDSCEVCQGRRVLPRIHFEGLDPSSMRQVRSRARFLDRVERELWPLLHRRDQPRTGVWIDFDVPF